MVEPGAETFDLSDTSNDLGMNIICYAVLTGIDVLLGSLSVSAENVPAGNARVMPKNRPCCDLV